MKTHKTNTTKEKLLESVSYDIERLKSGEKFTGMSIYNAYFYDEPANLLDYLAEDAVVFFDEMSRVQEAAEQLDNEEAEWYKHSLEMNYLMNNMTFSYDVTKIRKKLSQQKIYLSIFMRHIPNTKLEQTVNRSTRTMQEFHGQMLLLIGYLERWVNAEFLVVVFAVVEEIT